MQKIVYIMIAIVVVAAGWFYMSGPMAPQGRVVFAITDAAAGLENLTSVTMTVKSVEVQNSANSWVTVSSQPYDFDLLKLKKSGALELLADTKLNAGTYNQIRLNIGKVVVVKSGQSFEAKLPSNELKIVGKVIVDADSTSSAVLDFLLDKSLHITGNGLYVFAPVVKVMNQSKVTVEVGANRVVTVGAGGKIDADISVGMNEKGETKENFQINSNSKVEIDGGVIKIGAGAEAEVKGGVMPTYINLSAQNNSGISGKAIITKIDGRAQVRLELTGAAYGLPRPAHVHVGSCANIGAVKYPLSDVITGNSTTYLSVTLDQMKAELPLAINVHQSIAEVGTYVACGDVKF
jgi:hypothetical protein